MPIKKQVIIYTLNCPVKDAPVYVGMTMKSIDERYKGHLHSIKHGRKVRLLEYFRGLKCLPSIQYLDSSYVESKQDALNLELYWIYQMKCWGFELLNSQVSRKYKKESLQFLDEPDAKVYRSPSCEKEIIVVPCKNTRLVNENIKIVQLLSFGRTSKEVSILTSLNDFVVDDRLSKMRKQFGCKNNAHLTATLLRKGLIK